MIPRIWHIMAVQSWRIPEQDARVWWRALQGARWSVSREWREKILLFGTAGLSNAQAFVLETASPHAAVANLEALVGEGRLPRARASALTEHILALVDAQGHWR